MLDRFGGGVIVITIFILSLLVVTMVVWWAISRHRHRAARARFDDIPLFAVPGSSSPVTRPSYAPAHRPAGAELAAQPIVTPTSAHARYAPVSPTIRNRDGEISTLPRTTRSAPAAPVADEFGEAVDGESIRFWRPADGTLQFLPGRLEVAAGRDAGQEIRFVRTGGPDGTCITFGRAQGAPYRHVQLREPTVSRSHARMSLESPASASGSSSAEDPPAAGPRWRIENLSSTNPVLVNGRALGSSPGQRSSVILSDGDRIEMGEVAFIFRAR